MHEGAEVQQKQYAVDCQASSLQQRQKDEACAEHPRQEGGQIIRGHR